MLTVSHSFIIPHWLSSRRPVWTASSEFGTYRLCEQQRFRRACASAQSRQNLRCSLIQAVSQDRKPDPWPLWMAGHAQLKLVVTECSKTQIRLTGLSLIKMFKTKFLGSFPTTDNKRCPYSCHSIRPVWSESLLCAQCVAKDPSFLHADSEDSDQTGRSILPTFSILCLYLPDLFFYLH